MIDKFSYCEKIDRLLLILIKKDTLLWWIRHGKKDLISKVTGSFGKLFNKSVVYSRGAAERVRNKFDHCDDEFRWQKFQLRLSKHS